MLFPSSDSGIDLQFSSKTVPPHTLFLILPDVPGNSPDVCAEEQPLFWLFKKHVIYSRDHIIPILSVYKPFNSFWLKAEIWNLSKFCPAELDSVPYLLCLGRLYFEISSTSLDFIF